jgi:hypothetical protein
MHYVELQRAFLFCAVPQVHRTTNQFSAQH